MSASGGVRCVTGAVGRVLKEASARRETLGRAGADVGVGVDLLTTPVGARVRGAGEVGGEDLVSVWSAGEVGLDEPDEARAEHGRGGLDHLGFESLDRAEGPDQVALEIFGHGHLARWGDAVEEEVVVVRHAGVVEDGGILGFAGGGENNVLEVLGLEVGFCREYELVYASLAKRRKVTTYRPSSRSVFAGRGSGRHTKRRSSPRGREAREFLFVDQSPRGQGLCAVILFAGRAGGAWRRLGWAQ